MLLAVTLVVAAVQIDIRARPLAEVLEVLGKQDHAKYACSTEFRNEIIVLRTNRRASTEIRGALAKVMNADWVDRKGTLTLERSAEETKRLTQELSLQKLDMAKAFLAAIVKEAAKPSTEASRFKTFNEAVADNPKSRQAPFIEGPAGYWFKKIILKLKPEDLASVSLTDSSTFSNKPTQFQKALPKGSMELVKSMTDELERLREVAAPDEERTRTFNANVRVSTISPDRVLLAVRGRASYWTLGLEVYDSTGKRNLGTYISAYDLGLDPRYPIEGVKSQARFVPLGPLSAQLLNFRVPVGQGVRPKPSAELHDALLHPEDHDPLSYFDTEAVLGVAGEGDVCARLPDSTYIATSQCWTGGQLNVGKFQSLAEPSGGLLLKNEAGWLLGMPRSPTACESERFSRQALGRFVRSNDKAGRETFDSLCRYYFEAGPQVMTAGFWKAARRDFVLLGVHQTQDAGSHPYPSAALIGSLTESQKLALLKGGTLTYGGTIGKQRDLFTQLLGLAYVEGDAVPDLVKEPTEWMARVNLKDVRLSLTPSPEQVVIDRDGVDDYMVLPEEFAMWFQSVEQLSNSSARFGTRDLVTLEVHPATSISFKDAFEVDHVVPKEPVDFKDLPESMRSRIEEALRKARGGVF